VGRVNTKSYCVFLCSYMQYNYVNRAVLAVFKKAVKSF